MDQQAFDAFVVREKEYLATNLCKIGFQEQSARLAAERFFYLKAVTGSSYHDSDFVSTLKFIDEQFERSENNSLIVFTAMRIGRAFQELKEKIDFDKDVSRSEELDFFVTEIRESGAKKYLFGKPRFENLPENAKDEICKQTQFMTLEEEAYFAYQLLMKIEFEPFTDTPKEFLEAVVYWSVVVPARQYWAAQSDEPDGPQP